MNRRYDFINLNKTTIIAHRGASGIAPENSIPAIDEAGKMGYFGVELDICSSSDGVLYLLHDGKLDRTTDGSGSITDKTSTQIDNLRINRGANIDLYPDLKIPRFEDALEECEKNNLVPVFDIKVFSKKDRDVNTFINIIYKHNYEKKLLVHSFNYKIMEDIRKKNKEIILMPMVNPKDKVHGYNYIRSFGFTGLDCYNKYLNKALVQRAHKDGLKVFAWTVDKPSTLKKDIDMGVDFIYSNKIPPDKTSKQNIKKF
nr:glycerophosphodiester phosphodiesterase family protein [Clostridium algifaecis]